MKGDTPRPDTPVSGGADEPRLIERKHDDDCGCPEELWEAFGAHLHAHLSAGKPSNAHADYGDYGERTMEVTCDTHDLARAAIFGWARELERPGAALTPAADRAMPAGEDALREAAQSVLDRMFCTYTARNGREVGIQGDDGEKCWIVHSDDIEALRRALATPPASTDAQAGMVAGPIWREEEEESECWTAEVQTVGGYYVVATVHGASRAQAEQRQTAILAALARRDPEAEEA